MLLLAARVRKRWMAWRQSGSRGVMDVVGEVGADGVGGEGEFGGPLVDELLGVGHAGVAAGV